MNELFYFILSLLPVPLWYVSRQRGLQFQLLLSFSGAFLLGLMFTHLLPTAFDGPIEIIAPVILGGFFVQLVVEHLTKGIEHGHVHMHGGKPYGFPYLFIAALYFHAFTESFPLGDFVQDADHKHFHTEWYAAGLLVHKWPVVLALLTFLDKMKISITRIIIVTFIFATAMPLGALLAPYIPLGDDQFFVLRLCLAFSVGILLHVSTTILFEAEQGHKLQWKKVIAVILGFSFSMMVLLA